ncbi:hypothetical protein GLOIN_2v1613916 [Rhizophagus irregularis DAOM 181602=DAOM 197198]|uniref:Uncharacterized protein n=1 Tax=Rhizophagus irregularis (strain DAOM 181602 / DAOM 197198 / MUCL 43194) TaxID=747089 RepID=A0A2P4PZA4_RHIID|nr:hypothetical protein GLOIN_2v1613916 [Rhizophagus irregularis DAOM 181602=DAOM 197198]POG70709.1 hypothetical protein GLOIN_2v1613916 [Rhizophagus irregularis DAOM 181602=DAOM 197198]|eukprot:XP_025177575.1 hypothetical protein GLOIN_2v1613916 [Rhizophagus irregularis DAOM 181602=DAOM 197198]
MLLVSILENYRLNIIFHTQPIWSNIFFIRCNPIISTFMFFNPYRINSILKNSFI